MYAVAHVQVMCFADSAQPRNCSNVTRPFPILWVGSGDETRKGEGPGRFSHVIRGTNVTMRHA